MRPRLDKRAVAALYRSSVRQARLLPHSYLRQFFRIKISDDFRHFFRPKQADESRIKGAKRVQMELSKLQRANAGDKKAFAHILDLAYGRKGKLKWNIMKPILHDPDAPLPPRIIPGVERSRPPTYSRELIALLTSGPSRATGSAMKLRHIQRPPNMPARADPSSEEARLYGPFSKRRLANIRWRYFTEQWKRVRPPLELSVRGSDSPVGQTERTPPAGFRSIGLQDSGVLQDLIDLAGPMPRHPPTPRRHTIRDPPEMNDGSEARSSRSAPTRFLRRRYRELLARIPILTYSSGTSDKSAKSGSTAGKYTVSLAPHAILAKTRHRIEQPITASAVDLAWAEIGHPQQGSGGSVEKPLVQRRK